LWIEGVWLSPIIIPFLAPAPTWFTTLVVIVVFTSATDPEMIGAISSYHSGLLIKQTVGSIDTCKGWATHNKSPFPLPEYVSAFVDKDTKLVSPGLAKGRTYLFIISRAASNVMYAFTGDPGWINLSKSP